MSNPNERNLTFTELTKFLENNPFLHVIPNLETGGASIVLRPILKKYCTSDINCSELKNGIPLETDGCSWIWTTNNPPLRCGIATPCQRQGILVTKDLTAILNPNFPSTVITQMVISYDSNAKLEYQLIYNNGTRSPFKLLPKGCEQTFMTSPPATGPYIRGITFTSPNLNTEAIHVACGCATIQVGTTPVTIPGTGVTLSPTTTTTVKPSIEPK